MATLQGFLAMMVKIIEAAISWLSLRFEKQPHQMFLPYIFWGNLIWNISKIRSLIATVNPTCSYTLESSEISNGVPDGAILLLCSEIQHHLDGLPMFSRSRPFYPF